MANQKRYEQVHRTIDIVFRDVPLTVEFTFYPALPATEFEPPDYEYIEIDRVMVDEIDVMRLMGQTSFMELLDMLHTEVDKIKES